MAFEEPDNGVQPRRLALVAELVASLALGESPQQVILTTHSPLFCNAVIHLARQQAEKVRIYRTVSERGRTRFLPFDPSGPLMADSEIREALIRPAEEAVFEGLLLRGLLDG